MRLSLQDHLQVHPFWLMDVAVMESGGVPILTPLFGFSTITAPEVTMETKDITEGNWIWKTKVLKKHAEVGNITLTRGVTFHDLDFYAWMINALAGENLVTTLSSAVAGKVFNRTASFQPRRSLLLLHFFAHNPIGTLTGAAVGAVASLFGGDFNSIASQGFPGLGSIPGATQLFADASPYLPSLGPVDAISNVSRLVPARAFMLHGCLPVRYKTGSDFDASSGAVSIMELELAVEQMEQVVLSA